MPTKIIGFVLPCVVVGMAVWAFGQGRPANPAPASDNPQSLTHVEKARKLAGTDVTAPFNFYCVPGVARGTSDDAPDLEPVKLFDNLYAAGNSEETVYAITTAEGIILIDSGSAERVERVLIPGLRKLGLEPANVKYILLGHAHADHFGGSKYFQDRYGTKVGMSAADWDFLEKQSSNANPNAPKPPKRDFIVTEGEPIKLGNVTVTPVLIPGHTPGSLAYIFPVKEGAATYMAGLFGGTMLSSFLRSGIPEIRQYIDSINHYLDVARRMNVEVEIQNHPLFDDTPARLAALKLRKTGEPHPFRMGNETYLKFWNIIAECMQAEIARRGK
jgi:metallo-beta-lactamase class B